MIKCRIGCMYHRDKQRRKVKQCMHQLGCARWIVTGLRLWDARASLFRQELYKNRATFKILKTNINEIVLFVNKLVYLRPKAFTMIVANIISPANNNALEPNLLTCGLSP